MNEHLNNILTPDEIKFIKLIAHGYTNESIKIMLGITINAVEYQIKKVYAKLKTTKYLDKHHSDRVMVALYYFRYCVKKENN